VNDSNSRRHIRKIKKSIKWEVLWMNNIDDINIIWFVSKCFNAYILINRLGIYDW
jgi:hypothetical protein